MESNKSIPMSYLHKNLCENNFDSEKGVALRNYDLPIG